MVHVLFDLDRLNPGISAFGYRRAVMASERYWQRKNPLRTVSYLSRKIYAFVSRRSNPMD
jgi:hypothetical protein